MVSHHQHVNFLVSYLQHVIAGKQASLMGDGSSLLAPARWRANNRAKPSQGQAEGQSCMHRALREEEEVTRSNQAQFCATTPCAA